jgi:DNA polymerase III subunit epsilon
MSLFDRMFPTPSTSSIPGLVTRLFRPQVELPEALAQRVRAWRALHEMNERAAFAQARFVVVDVETSGLDARRDRLLAIGAVMVEAQRLLPGQGYAAFLRAATPSSHANILVHGITPQVQRRGSAPEAALMGFLEFARRDVLVAFHARFDQTVLDRAVRTQLGVRLLNPWIDVAQLAPALVPEARLANRPLDDWLGYFGLRAQVRHSAASDAFATGELMLILLARAARQGLTSVSQLRAACEQQQRLLPGGGAGGV